MPAESFMYIDCLSGAPMRETRANSTMFWDDVGIYHTPRPESRVMSSTPALSLVAGQSAVAINGPTPATIPHIDVHMATSPPTKENEGLGGGIPGN